MTDQQRRFETFAALHRPGDPLVLFNAWDAGSATAIADAGAPAVATGSWSVAAANGYRDGEGLPIELALETARRIVTTVQVPVTIDFEGAYAVNPDDVARNVAQLAATGAVGCNFEDQVVDGDGLHPIELHARRLVAIRRSVGRDFFINARTDVFLKREREDHGRAIDEALERAHAYAAAGASGLFVPGLVDRDLIGDICERSPLPVNVMISQGLPAPAELGTLGVARISHGPGPYRQMIAWLTETAAAHYVARRPQYLA